jgi:hypothetical protein
MSLPQIIPSFPDINLVGGLTYSVQTIGAVEALLFTASPNPDVVVKYDSSVQAVALDLSLAIGFERNVLAKNDSGVVTLGIPHSSFTDKNGEITADCFWRLTGSIVELVVMGAHRRFAQFKGVISWQLKIYKRSVIFISAR